MLTLDQIKQRYGDELFRRSPRSILTEYLQYEILDSLFKQEGSEKLSFMGGTAVRIVYGGHRFSEDLDFDNFGLTFSEFENLAEKIASDMKTKGFKIEFRMVQKGAYHCYARFPDLLFKNGLSANQDEKILIRLDTVHKKRCFVSDVFVLNGFDVYRKIPVNPVHIVLTQKLAAIVLRKREKGRDFYDVSYLFGFAKVDYDYLQSEYGINKQELRKKILNRANDLNMKDLSNDVLPFLINLDDHRRVLEFREYMEQIL